MLSLLINAHELYFVCVHIEAFAAHCPFQTMQQDSAWVDVFARSEFTNLPSSVSSTESDINTRLAKALTAIDRLSVIYMKVRYLSDKIKQFFQAAVVSVVTYIFSYRNCVITPGWWLMRAGHRTCFQMLYDEIMNVPHGLWLSVWRKSLMAIA